MVLSQCRRSKALYRVGSDGNSAKQMIRQNDGAPFGLRLGRRGLNLLFIFKSVVVYCVVVRTMSARRRLYLKEL